MSLANSFLQNYTAITKKIFPQKAFKPSVGLDIGLSTVKMAQLAPSEYSYELLSWAIEPIQNTDIKTTIKKILDRSGESDREVKTSVFGKGTLIRYIELPRMGLEEIRKSLNIEADKYFPFPADQLYLDCCILDPKGTEKMMSVLVACAKKELIDARIKFLNELGLSIDFIGVNSIALANAFLTLNASPKGSIQGQEKKEFAAKAILDIGNEESHLIILVDQTPRFDRDIYIGGRHFTQAISNALGLSFKEAEKLKCHPQGRLDEIANACEASFTNLVSDLRLSFDYFISEKNIPIAKLYLMGGGSLLEGMDLFFTKHLELPVERWNPVDYLKIEKALLDQDVRRHAAELGVAIGLAL